MLLCAAHVYIFALYATEIPIASNADACFLMEIDENCLNDEENVHYLLLFI